MEVSRIKYEQKNARTVDEDRISKLSDDLIHQILSYLDARLAVQTSVLSKRWKLVWTTLPFLNFNEYNFVYCKFMIHVFTRRDHISGILKLHLFRTNVWLFQKYINYAVSHDVQHLTLESDHHCSLSSFNSKTLKELKLTMPFESEDVTKGDCWSLPNLTTLHLKRSAYRFNYKLKVHESCLNLPALTTLDLTYCELPELFSLPMLTTLCLERCTLPQKVWDLPALRTLQLVDMVFPENMSDYFLALASLRTLVIDFALQYLRRLVISSSYLVNLKIKVSISSVYILEHKIVVLAPKLCNFEAIGFFRLVYEGSELENAIIKYWDIPLSSTAWRHYDDLIETMFSQLGSAKILSLDLVTIQLLSQNPDIVAHWHCPFYNLKHLKLPRGCEESSVSSAVRNYLLSGSPCASIVKPMPQIPGERLVHGSIFRDSATGFSGLAYRDGVSPDSDASLYDMMDNADLGIIRGHMLLSLLAGVLVLSCYL
ncbi:hypothetical protein ACET3Z_028919 [Daucus carota]